MRSKEACEASHFQPTAEYFFQIVGEPYYLWLELPDTKMFSYCMNFPDFAYLVSFFFFCGCGFCGVEVPGLPANFEQTLRLHWRPDLWKNICPYFYRFRGKMSVVMT